MEDVRTLILFGGKGGVGKTTVSAAFAVKSAVSGVRTLHITADNPPCLSYFYGIPIGDKIVNVAENLDAVELSPEVVSKRWHDKFGNDFRMILSHFLDMDAIDRDSHLPLMNYVASTPALRSEALIDLILEMAEKGGYGKIFCDAAPTVETLNLFSLPKIINTNLKSAAKMYETLDFFGGRLSGNKPIADIVDQWGDWSNKAVERLRTGACMVVVATPEALAVNYAREITESLLQYKMPLRGIVVNRTASSEGPAFSAELAARQEAQIKKLIELAGDRPVAKVAAFAEETTGLAVLQKIGTQLARIIHEI